MSDPINPTNQVLDELKEKLKAFKEKNKVIEPVKVSEPIKLSERAKILQEFDGIESDIPITHRYWKLPRK